MPANTRILIVEDHSIWSEFLQKRYKYEIADILGVDPNWITVEAADSFDLARSMIVAARLEPYDLVSLDINLGGTTEDGPHKDGLQLLGDIARLHSAWMVAILTGAESDPNFSGKRANIVRRNLRSLAMQTFPPERLVIIEKPTELTSLEGIPLKNSLSDSEKLANRIRQVISIFEHTSSYRNVFRKLILPNEYKAETVSKDEEPSDDAISGQSKKARREMEWREGYIIHWQIRYDCGEMITVPDKAGMEVIRVLLENEHKEFSYGALEAAAMGETAMSKDDFAAEGKPKDNLEGRTQWEQIADGTDESESDDDSIKAVAKAMVRSGQATEQDNTPDDLDKETRDSYERELRKLEARADDLAKTGNSQALAQVKKEVAQLRTALGKLRRGVDNKEAQRVRAHKSRILAYLREQGLVDLANDLDAKIKADGGTIAYWPNVDMNWQTS